MESSTLNRTVKYTVCLPSDYYTSGESYPILYMLHGYGNNNRMWQDAFKTDKILEKSVSENKAMPMILIMPDAARSWYIDGQKEQYETFFFEEFIPHIESQFRCAADKNHRAITEISMGGYGALLYSLKHPDMFSSCVALSSGVMTELDVKYMPEDIYSIFAEPFGDRSNELWKTNNIINLIKSVSPENKDAVKFYIDCGDDDFLYRGNGELHTAMRDAKVPHEYRVRDGAHTMDYWTPIVPMVFEFVSVNFKK